MKRAPERCIGLFLRLQTKVVFFLMNAVSTSVCAGTRFIAPQNAI